MESTLKIILAVTVALLMGCTPAVKQKAAVKDQPQQKIKEKKKMEVKQLNKEEFKKYIIDYEQHPDKWVFEGNKPAVIDFYATWCGPCKATAPVVEAMAQKYDGKIDFYKVDVDEQEELAGLFGVQSIPTLVFIPQQGDPVKEVGAMNQSMLEGEIKQLLLK